MSNRTFVQQNLSIGNTGIRFWDSSWKGVDVETVRSKRSANIAEGLKKDEHYSKVANERIGGN